MPTPDEHANIDLAAPSPALPPSSALQSPHLPGCLTPTLPAHPALPLQVLNHLPGFPFR